MCVVKMLYHSPVNNHHKWPQDCLIARLRVILFQCRIFSWCQPCFSLEYALNDSHIAYSPYTCQCNIYWHLITNTNYASLCPVYKAGSVKSNKRSIIRTFKFLL